MNIEKGALEFVVWLEAIVKGIDGDINELNKRSTEQQIEIKKLLTTVTKVDEFLKRVYK